MKTALLIAALALCLMNTSVLAQTPAQDKATVEADKQALSDAQAAVQADTLQLNTDQKSGNQDAAQADTNKLITDTQAQTDAEQQLNDDRKDLHKDKKNFDAND